jgi:hypothetical protein
MSYEEAKLWFGNLETSWLLILDNADNPTIDYSEFFISGCKGCILFTTRNEQCGIYGTVGCHKFDKLAISDAVTLLLKSCGFRETAWPERSEEARILIGDEFLAQHALAISQAGAFIKQGLCKLEEYQTMFEKQRQRLLTYCPTQAKSIYGDVYATFEVSANAIQGSSEQECKDALKLLEVLAFLHREGAPEEMFIRAGSYAFENSRLDEKDDIDLPSLWQINNIKAILHENTTLQELDLLAFRQAQQVLRSFSLTTINQESNEISMHPLVHKWARDRLHSDLQIAAWGNAASILSLSTRYDLFNTFNNVFDFHYFNMIKTHIEYCLILQPQGDFSTSQYPPLDICRIFYRFTYVLYYTRYDGMAEILANGLLMRIGHEIPPRSRNWSALKYLAVICQQKLGKHEEALQSIKEVVLSHEENEVDPKSHESLSARRRLAMALQNLWRYQEAIDILEDVVEIMQKTLSSTNRELLLSRSALASVYLNSGQPEEAIKVLQEVVRLAEKVFTPTSQEILSFQSVLAVAHLQNGQPEEAIKPLQETVRIRQNLHAPTYPELLASQQNLARAYLYTGQPEEAIKLLLEVERIRGNSLATTHPDRWQS